MVTVGRGSHAAGSVVSWEKPLLQEMQSPLPSEHWAHPSLQTGNTSASYSFCHYKGISPWQLPSELRKNPSVHLAQAVPLVAVVHPVLQLHWPSEAQTPLRQLHDEGGLLTTALKHRPLPETPSSQVWQPEGQGEQFGPKNPLAQDSQELPVNPAGHAHVPDAEHMPAPEQAGEQADDCMSRTAMLLRTDPEGS